MSSHPRFVASIQAMLFKLVSYITGFKNSLKGVGYFIGAACLQVRPPARLTKDAGPAR